MTPDPMRATAERLAREVVDRTEVWEEFLPHHHARFIACVLAGLSHRDQHAEREAAKKALLAVMTAWRETPIGGDCVDRMLDVCRRYLAAEFDAGERVTLSDGSVVRYVRSSDSMVREYPDGYTGSCKAEFWPGLLNRPTDTGADFDAVKRLAEQRGAER